MDVGSSLDYFRIDLNEIIFKLIFKSHKSVSRFCAFFMGIENGVDVIDCGWIA